MSALPSYCLHLYHHAVYILLYNHAVYIYFTTILFTSLQLCCLCLQPDCLQLLYHQAICIYISTRLFSVFTPPTPTTTTSTLCLFTARFFFGGGRGGVRGQFLCFTFVECHRSVPAFCYQDKLLHLFAWWFAERCGLNAMSLAPRTSLLRKSSWH